MLRADIYTLMQLRTDTQEETYHTITIYRIYNEVPHDEKPFLCPSIVSERYESTSIYLDTHFQLLREDFVRPLREGVLELLQSFDKGLRKKKFDDIRIYFDTRIVTPACSPTGTVYKAQFDTKPLKFVRWQNSRWLLYSLSLSFPGIYAFQKHGMVHVGGRSSSEVLKQFTLRELRNKCEFPYNLPMHVCRAYVKG